VRELIDPIWAAAFVGVLFVAARLLQRAGRAPHVRGCKTFIAGSIPAVASEANDFVDRQVRICRPGVTG
jgi:hypothetical protein